MSEVQRYSIKDGWLVADESGKVVSYEAYAALQQNLDAVLAENAKLMSGFSFFMYSDDSGFETYKTEAEAIAAANEMIGCCREDAASDGWPEETETILWGVIRQQAVECDYQKASEENGWMGWCDYKLSPETPTTDAILNEVRAEGVEMFAAEREELRKHYVAKKDREMAVSADHCAMAAFAFAEELRARKVGGATND